MSTGSEKRKPSKKYLNENENKNNNEATIISLGSSKSTIPKLLPTQAAFFNSNAYGEIKFNARKAKVKTK